MTTYGEQMPLETQNQLAGRCAHCGGLIVPDADDPGHRKCSECCRSTFTPTAAILAEPPQSAKREHSIFKSLYPDGFKVQGQRRDAGIPQASINAFTGRFR